MPATQEDRQLLGSPIKLPFSGKTVKRRFLKSAMTERLCRWDEKDESRRGFPSDAYTKLYHEWGCGGFGIIVLGNIPVHPGHLEARGNMIIAKELSWDPVEGLKPVITASKADGALVLGQITAGGRQVPTLVRDDPISPSGGEAFDAMGMHFNASREMSVEEIEEFVERYAYAAEVLYKAGADGAQLHAAHGYLLSQFLSPLHNRRTDAYGGDFERRSKIVFDIAKRIRDKVPDKSFILAIKINSQDFKDGGFDAEACKQMVSKLEENGFDVIELSGGTYESMSFEHKKDSTKQREGYFVELADQIRPAVKKAVLVVTGGFRSGEKMAEAIRKGTCDVVGLARPVTQHPRLPAEIVEGVRDGAVDNHIDPSLQTPASVLQIHQIGEGKPIVDHSDGPTVKEVHRQIQNQDIPAPQGDYPPM